MAIPAGTKFHGVAPEVETENRGSNLSNSQRDTYTIEEIQENKEQIEISKFYERLPHTTIIALKEFLEKERI